MGWPAAYTYLPALGNIGDFLSQRVRYPPVSEGRQRARAPVIERKNLEATIAFVTRA